MFKNFIQKRLESYVRKYFARHSEVKLVVVAGSVGKTSTKTAIATLLSERYRVGMHAGNHNSGVSAPVAILGLEYPASIRNPFAWLRVFAAARKRIKEPTGVDVIIQELGIDHVGEMQAFSTYLKPDIAVVTAVTAEHMEFFKDMETVAREELMAANFSDEAIINRDDIDGKYATYLTNGNVTTYGTSGLAEYRFEVEDFTVDHGYTGAVVRPEDTAPFQAAIRVVGEHSLRPAMGAVAVASKLGLTSDQIVSGLAKLRAVKGRMNVLRGVEQSIIIDDTYNSSPVAAISALQALYNLQAPQRIAILGSMNEMGDTSQVEHQRLGAFCDPSLLAWVVTVGDDANNYLAPAARARGCQVRTCKNALEAGAFVHQVLEQKAIVLAKGSQGGVYLEEAIKVILHETHDDQELVRQSPAWTKIKNDFFNRFPSVK